MKNLCIITTSTQSISSFLKKYIHEFSKKDINITLVSNFHKNQKNFVNIDFVKDYKNVKIHHIPFDRKPNLYLDIISLIKLINFFRNNNFDMFFSLTPKAGFISSLAGTFSNIKHRIHIFTGQVWYTKKGLIKIILKKFDKLIGILNTESLVDSASQKDFLINEKVFDAMNNNLNVIGEGSICGVDIDTFQKVHDNKKKQLKEKFHIENDAKIIVFLGRLNRDKGVYDLSKAFDLVKKNYKKKLNLIFVGFDEENCNEHIKKISNNYKDIFFFNYSGSPNEYLQMSDIFCLPSYREGFGLSALEAGACNLPSVTSNTIGLSDVIIENKTGFTHEPGNVDQIKNNLLKLLNDENLCKDLGINARDRIVNKFDSKIIVKSYIENFKNIAKDSNFSLIGTSAKSIYNFRGSFVETLKKKNFKISAFAGKLARNDLDNIKKLNISYTDYSVTNASFNFFNEMYVIIKLFFNLKKKNQK